MLKVIRRGANLQARGASRGDFEVNRPAARKNMAAMLAAGGEGVKKWRQPSAAYRRSELISSSTLLMRSCICVGL